MALVDALGEPQRIERLTEVFLPGVEVDEHQGLGVASQRVHQQVGQLRVAIGDVARPVLQKNKAKMTDLNISL